MANLISKPGEGDIISRLPGLKVFHFFAATDETLIEHGFHCANLNPGEL
jgi:hypothetical protein